MDKWILIGARWINREHVEMIRQETFYVADKRMANIHIYLTSGNIFTVYNVSNPGVEIARITNGRNN